MNTQYLIISSLSIFLKGDIMEGLLALLVILPIIIYLVISSYKKKHERKEIIQTGKPASAFIVDFQEAKDFMTPPHSTGYLLQLSVKPTEGPEFTASKHHWYGENNPPNEGDILYLMYNPADKSQMEVITKKEFVAAGGALPSETMQAKF